MPCYYPLSVFYRQESFVLDVPAAIIFNSPLEKVNMQLPCGQCVGCRQRRARDWAIRCVHEASLYERNCFITLTYNDENLPQGHSLVYEHFQQFMKRLRFHYKGHRQLADGTNPIRFYMAGEYGENFGRPHFHACIFNFDFDDKIEFKKSPSGEILFRSKKLESLWEFGYSSIGGVTFQSAAYVARYINKKITGQLADQHYEYIDANGEIFWRTPEFNKMSLKPGIGADWLKKYKSDVFPHDYVVSKGVKLPVPRYYSKIYKCSNPYEWDEVSNDRYYKSRELLDNNTPDRLAVREQVALANLKRLKRSLK